VAEMSRSKKNPLIEKTRNMAGKALEPLQFDSSLKKGFIRERLLSDRSYERHFKKGIYELQKSL
jgi:hypothetical protein